MNKMQELRIEKVTVNIGVGSPGERLDHAKELLRRLTGREPIETTARRREPVFKLRPGLPIGTKVTLRGPDALAFLDKALTARKRRLSPRAFDREGNFSFGVPEYIDFPGAKYDPAMGIMGFDVCVRLVRRGMRIHQRRIAPARVGRHHRVRTEEAQQFAQEKLNIKFTEE